MVANVDQGGFPLSRDQVRFPVELRASPDLRADDPGTWPRLEGRLELVGGRLLYMPPCGDVQQDVAAAVSGILWSWCEGHPDYVVGSNEAGMMLGGDVRGADAAVWLRADLGPPTGGFRRVPPILAVEIAGQDEGETDLREKARWYFAHGVRLVWLILPEAREVLVLTSSQETRHGPAESLPAYPLLPSLTPAVERIFGQLGR